MDFKNEKAFAMTINFMSLSREKDLSKESYLNAFSETYDFFATEITKKPPLNMNPDITQKAKQQNPR